MTMRSAASRIHYCSTAIECSELTPQSGTMPWICAYFAIDADAKAYGYGREVVMHGVRVVGSTSSVACRHSIGKVLAFACIKPVVNEARKAVVLCEAA